MKTAKKFFAVTVAFCAVGTAAFAGEAANVQSYAHPTLFGSSAQMTAGVDNVYQVGAKILKNKNRIGVKNKSSLYVDSCAKNLLNVLKESQASAGYSKDMFDSKKPILRSELAVVLAEGLSAKTSSKVNGYSDVEEGYWAKKWIYNATDAGLMIGYPSGAFKPNQVITKAEVFATIAKQIKVEHSATATPVYNGKAMKFIPEWAYGCTNEVIASGLLKQVPDQDKVINAEYLSKEQVAYLVGALSKNYSYSQSLKAATGAKKAATAKAGLTTLNIKMLDRLSAKVSNVGDAFTAKTTQSVVYQGVTFPEGSIVRGEVVEVQRPGIGSDNAGYIKVKFNKIKDIDADVEKALPAVIASADANELKNPNFVARLLGFPFTGAGRVAGVAGRSASSAANVVANGVEQLGENFGNTLTETLSLHAGRGMASFGNVLATTGKGVYDIAKVAASGTVGVVYELADEITYVFVPSLSNSSSLNPNEELTIVF